MRYFYLMVGLIFVSGCTQGASSLPASGNIQTQAIRAAGTKPHITSVSAIKPEQYQKITITGSGFGTSKPFNGDSDYIRIRDKTGKWDAGHISASETDSVWLDVTQWTDTKIVITGFTNDYGESGWVLNKGDHLETYVWNAQDGDGPATKAGKVK